MFKSVGIQNFQSHTETLIEFCDGLNVIAGSSDSGKSAILRAMAWVIKNRPSGDAIKNWNSGKNDSVIVEISLKDPITGKEDSVSKERSSKTTSYSLSTLTEPLSVVGRDVPIEVSNLINFSDLNFKSQHDPYLLAMTPGAIAKMINDLVGLSIIDVSLKNLNSQSTSLKRTCDNLIADANQKEEEIKSLSYLEQLGIDISGIEELEPDLGKVSDQIFGLNKRVKDISDIQEQINNNNYVLEASAPAKEILDLMESLDRKELKISRFIADIASIEKISVTLEEDRAWLQAKQPSQEILDLIFEWKAVEQKKTKISIAFNNYLVIKKQASESSCEVQNREVAYKTFLEQAKVCPTCLRTLDKKAIEFMIGKAK
jgi:exonuclease SbcC